MAMIKTIKWKWRSRSRRMRSARIFITAWLGLLLVASTGSAATRVDVVEQVEQRGGTWETQRGLEVHETAVIAPGRYYDWSLPRGVNISVSNGSVVRAADKGAFVRLTGKKQGTVTVRAGFRTLQLTVLAESKFALYERLRRTMAGMRGLKLATSGAEIEVRGRLLRLEDWIELAQAASGSNHGYQFRAELEPFAGKLKARADEHLRTLLRAASLPDLSFELEPAATVIVPDKPEELRARVARVLQPYGFRLERASSALSLEPLVRVRILVAEFRKKMMSRIGLQWPAAIEGQLLPSQVIPADRTLAVSLNALEENGLGKILASPVLLCRSGEEAQFLAGGEFPIKIANFKTQDVVWKKYGVLLKIGPRADFSGRMSINITTEVSMIDTSQTVDGIPGLLTNRIETHFDLSSSRTIALSGLLKKEWGDSRGGLPLLNSIPILGALFSSRDFRENRTELVVFVTPDVLRPDGIDTRAGTKENTTTPSASDVQESS